MAHLQHITYREYLPALLGQPLPLYAGYNASVNPGMDNFFATVTGRYAHPEATMLVLRLDDKWSEIAEGHLRARDVLFNPRVGLAAGSDALLRGMMLKPIAEVRPRYHADLRRNLGAKPYAGARGQDLLATDIWRGRDHGLPTYNEARALYGLPRKASFAEITSDAATRRGLEAAYASVDDVDGIVGALAEDPSRGSVGELLVASLVDQFQRLRDGDRLWYENAQFGAAELREIQTTRLADLVQRNSDIDPPYPNVFYTPDSQLDGGLFPVPEVRDLALEAEFERSQLLDKNFRLLWTVDYANQQVHLPQPPPPPPQLLTAKAVAGGYCRLQMPRGTGAGHRLGALQRGGGYLAAPFQCIPARAPPPPPKHRPNFSLNSWESVLAPNRLCPLGVFNPKDRIRCQGRWQQPNRSTLDLSHRGPSVPLVTSERRECGQERPAHARSTGGPKHGTRNIRRDPDSVSSATCDQAVKPRPLEPTPRTPAREVGIWALGATSYRGGNNLGGDKFDVDKFGSPTSYQIFPSSLTMRCVKLCAPGMGCRRSPSRNISNHPEPIKKYQQPSRGHQEISATIQRPQGNNSSHPRGSNSKGPYTKIFLHF